jgi:thiol-disulfide isomerase/thioredoxin
MDRKKIFILGVGALAILLVLLVFLSSGENTIEAGKYDEVAICLKDQGAVFYGTFWCPFCKKQKDMFGSSARLLPYVECSTLDGRSQVPFCREKQISGYPTWDFADGSRLQGLLSFETLAEKTGCELPGDLPQPVEDSGGSSDASVPPSN